MVSFAGHERAVLAELAAPGHFGAAGNGFTIVVRNDIAFATIIAKKDRQAMRAGRGGRHGFRRDVAARAAPYIERRDHLRGNRPGSMARQRRWR